MKINITDLKESAKDYLVDTSASWVFYTPLMALEEAAIAGMEPNEVIKSRLAGIAVQSLVMRPYGKFRQGWANYWGANESSSKLKKTLIDTSSSVLYQLPVYSSILALAGASFDEICVALPLGLVIGITSGRPYGYFLDKWRKTWKRRSTL